MENSRGGMMDQWMWMMNYCQKRRIPPAQAWAWEQAKKAYEEMMKAEVVKP